MKIGVTTFGYENFAVFREQLSSQGYYAANLGDNMQSIAARRLLARLGVPDADVVPVNRDTLASYAGPDIALIMNGVFAPWCFPVPPQVTPIFIGLCVREPTIARHRDYFARFQPIGCRDVTTQQLFEKHGVEAFVSGCLTLTLAERQAPMKADKVLIVHGSGAGAFPSAMLKWAPPRILEDIEFVYQRLPSFRHPLDREAQQHAEAYAEGLLKYYAETARLVITPLHHAAAPCMALGIPVIIARNAHDARFSYLAQLTRIHTAEDFDQIDWSPQPVPMDAVRRRLESLLAEKLRELQR